MKGYNDGFSTLCARTTHSSIWKGDRSKILIRDNATTDRYDVVTVRITEAGDVEIYYSPELASRLSCKPGTDDELS